MTEKYYLTVLKLKNRTKYSGHSIEFKTKDQGYLVSEKNEKILKTNLYHTNEIIFSTKKNVIMH